MLRLPSLLAALRLFGVSASVGIDDVDGSFIFSFNVGVYAISSADVSCLSISFNAATFGVSFDVRFDAAADVDVIGVLDVDSSVFSSALKSVSRSEEASSSLLRSSFDEESFSLDESNLGRAVPAVTPRPVIEVWYFGLGPFRIVAGAGVDSARGLPVSESESLKREIVFE